jgi:heme/copper-type cytochrome/quinol oxidase subunit 2
MVIGTALGWTDWQTVALAVALAFLFGYALTSLPLLRTGMALAAVVPIALASDTLSIATMEVVDNAILLIIPGAMEAGLSDLLFWGSLAFALFIAFVLTVPVNRWLIARGKGHTAVHETGIHGGPPVKLVAVVVVAMAIFGSAVLIGEVVADDDGMSDEPATSGEAMSFVAPAAPK